MCVTSYPYLSRTCCPITALPARTQWGKEVLSQLRENETLGEKVLVNARSESFRFLFLPPIKKLINGPQGSYWPMKEQMHQFWAFASAAPGTKPCWTPTIHNWVVGHRPGQPMDLHMKQERNFIFVLEMCGAPIELHWTVQKEPALHFLFIFIILKLCL